MYLIPVTIVSLSQSISRHIHLFTKLKRVFLLRPTFACIGIGIIDFPRSCPNNLFDFGEDSFGIGRRWMRGRRGIRRASRWGGRRTRARPRTWWRSSPPRGPACRRRGSSRTSPALPVGEMRRWENLNYENLFNKKQEKVLNHLRMELDLLCDNV